MWLQIVIDINYLCGSSLINYFQSRTWQKLTCVTLLLLLNWNYVLFHLICFQIFFFEPEQWSTIHSVPCSHNHKNTITFRNYRAGQEVLYSPAPFIVHFSPDDWRANIPKRRRAHFSSVLLHIFLCETCIGNFSFFSEVS